MCRYCTLYIINLQGVSYQHSEQNYKQINTDINNVNNFYQHLLIFLLIIFFLYAISLIGMLFCTNETYSKLLDIS